MAAGPDLRSRIVAILKVGLPLFALGLLASLFLIQTDDRIGGGELVFSKGDVAALGAGQQVTNPTLSGTTKDNDRFRFTAARAVPDAAPPTKATITDLKGQIDFNGGQIVNVSADGGEMQLDIHQLELAGSVRADTTDGYRLRTDALSIDLNAGVLETTTPVATEGPLGTIDAGSMRVAPVGPGQKAHLISFGNGVRLVYHPPAPAAKDRPAAGDQGTDD